MRCYICNYATESDDKDATSQFKVDPDGKEVCGHCVKESRKYWAYSGMEGVHDCSSNIEHQVDELTKRIPTLMCGPSCPNDIPFSCKCTYKTGCKFFIDNPHLR